MSDGAILTPRCEVTDCKDDLTLAEAAKRLGVSSRTVGEWLQLGRLSGRRVGNRWRIPAVEVEVFAQPYELWQKQFRQTVEDVRGRIPEGVTSEEIDADVRAAFAEARAEPSLRDH